MCIMNIKIRLATHVYQSEHLVDNIYLNENLADTADTCGIHGPEVILPLRKNHYRELIYSFDENTTLLDLSHYIKDLINLPRNHGHLAFWIGSIRYWIDDGSASFKRLVNRFLDPQNTGIINVGLYISTMLSDAGWSGG